MNRMVFLILPQRQLKQAQRIHLVISFLFVLLSNDLSLKMLKPKRWKSIQRLSYVLFILILAHGIMYQIVEKRTVTIIIVFALIMIVPVIVQLPGFFTIKRNLK